MKPIHSKEMLISVKIFTNHNLSNEEFEEIFTNYLNKINTSLLLIETELNENTKVRTHIGSELSEPKGSILDFEEYYKPY